MCTDLELEGRAEGTTKVVKPESFEAGTSTATALGIEDIENTRLIDSRKKARRMDWLMAFMLSDRFQLLLT